MKRLPCDFTFTVDLMAEYFSVRAASPKNQRWPNYRTKHFLNAIGRLKNCREVCDGSLVWATFGVNAKTWEGMQAEVELTLAKIKRISKRYSKELK